MVYIGNALNWQSYFHRISASVNEIFIFEIIDIAFCYYVFSSKKIAIVWPHRKKIIVLKYRCKIKVIPRHQSNLIFHSVYMSYVYSFIYGFAKRFSLAFSEVANFSRHYLVSRRQILRCVETVQCLSSVAATFSGYMFARDVITRFRDERNIPS